MPVLALAAHQQCDQSSFGASRSPSLGGTPAASPENSSLTARDGGESVPEMATSFETMRAIADGENRRGECGKIDNRDRQERIAVNGTG